MICVDVRANAKQQETKELVDVSYQLLQQVYTLKTRNKIEKWHVFFI